MFLLVIVIEDYRIFGSAILIMWHFRLPQQGPEEMRSVSYVSTHHIAEDSRLKWAGGQKT
jgi:hypothetical protein